MKKSLLILSAVFMAANVSWAQCVPTCSNYAVSAITFTTFPSSGTNAIPLFSPNTDDGLTAPITLGFNFNFYCTTYSTVLIYTNGMLQFDIGAPSTFPTGYDPAQLFGGTTAAPNALVAFRMDDLDPGVGGTVTYATMGVSPNQMFVLTYSNVPIYGNSTLLNSGQIVLYEGTNIIDIYTIAAPLSPNLATQGIENASGTNGIASPGRNQSYWSATNSAYRFSPYTPAPPTSVSGNTLLCQGVSDFYQATFMVGASAYGWTMPSGWLGTSTISAITATAGVSGNLSVTATYTCGTSLPTVINVSVVPAPVVGIVSATPPILCSGGVVTFSTSGAVTYTLEPGGIIGTSPLTDVPLISTSYTLSGTNASGCVSNNNPSTFITVKETPTVTVNSGTICSGATFTQIASGATTYVYSSLFPTVSPTLAGQYTYSVTGTGTNGCVSNTAISTLTVYALPSLTATATRTAICLKESVSITASGANTYTWSNALVGPSITVSPNTTTVYIVTGADIHGCANSSSASVLVKPCVGINELAENQKGVTLFPNPNTGSFQILLNAQNEGASLQIYNSVAQLLIEQEITSDKTNIDLHSYNTGLYYIRVKNGQSTQVLKIIKE